MRRLWVRYWGRYWRRMRKDLVVLDARQAALAANLFKHLRQAHGEHFFTGEEKDFMAQLEQRVRDMKERT